MTGWCKSDSGVRQGCPLPPLLFNIYVMELGKVISNCVLGVKYTVVGKDGVMEWKSQAWSSFMEREVTCIVDWLVRIVYEESLVSDIGRA